MILERLTTSNFKGLPDRAFDFSAGLNLVVGPNRAGKSSLHQALVTALFGLGKAGDGLPAQWKEALRWGSDEEGSLILEYRTSSGRYRLERAVGHSDAKLAHEAQGEWRILGADVRQVQGIIGEHIGFASSSLFARTVSVAQGDLARLESADRREVGRALEEVLVGRSGATFQQALAYLEGIAHDRRTGLRKGERDREPRKLDRIEGEIAQMNAQMAEARGRDERLEQLRQEVMRLEADLPGKKARLQTLTRDADEEKAPGLLTKLRRKRELQERQRALIAQTRDFQRTVGTAKGLREEMSRLAGQLTAGDSLPKADLDEAENHLRELEQRLAASRQGVAGSEERIGKAQEGLEEVKAWFDGHGGFNDDRVVEKATDALREKSALEERVRRERAGLNELRKAKRPVSASSWELVVGALLLLGPLVFAWVSGRWEIAGGGVSGAVLLVDYARRLAAVRRSTGSFAVEEGVVAQSEEDLVKAREELATALSALGTSEPELSGLLMECRAATQKGQSLAKQIEGEKANEERAREGCSLAEAELARFCQQFGLGAADDLRRQVGLVRAIRGAEGKLQALLHSHTLEEEEEALASTSVGLLGVRKELESSEYADFSPTTEEAESWRQEAEALEKEVPELERQLLLARRDMQYLEQASKDKPTSHELEARLEWLRSELQRGDRTFQACQEAMRLLGEVQKEHRTTYLPALEQATSGHLKRMTSGFYSTMRLAEGWPQITVAEASNPAVPPEELSGGSRDQLYLAFRLAVADQLTGGEPLPLLLDEPFTNFDHHHRQRALDILADLGATGRQVIYFTMLPEVADALEQEAAGKFPVRRLALGSP